MFRKKVFILFALLAFYLNNNSFAQFNKEEESAKNILENCRERESKHCTPASCSLYVIGDRSFLFKDCKLQLIENIADFNFLVETKKFVPKYLPRVTYSQLPLGLAYTHSGFLKDFISKDNTLLSYFCKKFEQKVITADGESFYFIDDCKKKKFQNNRDADYFAVKKNIILTSIPEKELNLFPDGKPMVSQVQNPGLQILPKETEIIKNLPSKKELCGQLRSKIVSFHRSIFEVRNCILYPVSNISLEKMVDIENKGGIQELTLQQRLGLPESDVITAVR